MNQKPGTSLPFEAVENFRELGGYEGADGKHVRYGVFYRAPALANVRTKADRERFCSLGIKNVFDFRSAGEREAAPDPDFAGTRNIAVNAMTDGDGKEVNFDLEEIVKSRDGMEKMLAGVHESYARMPFSNPAYRALFQTIMEGGTPVLFHCTAGKDRTGVAAALILKALGASDETVMSDYLLTNEYRARGRKELAQLFVQMGLDEKNAENLGDVAAGVKAESLQYSLSEIGKRYPSFEDYLKAEYGIGNEELQSLRSRYLD